MRPRATRARAGPALRRTTRSAPRSRRRGRPRRARPTGRRHPRPLRAHLDDRVGRLIADLDGGVPLDARRADEPAVGSAGAHVPRPEAAAQLRLGEWMNHREHLELVVVDIHAVEAELLEVDVLGGPAVELEHVRAVRASHDRGRAARDAAVRDADADGRSAADRDGDHAARERAAVGELRAQDLRRSSRERDPAAGAPNTPRRRPPPDRRIPSRRTAARRDAKRRRSPTSAFAAASRPAVAGSPASTAPTPAPSEDENAIAEQPVSITPSAPIAPVPVMPATRAPAAASCASRRRASGSMIAGREDQDEPGLAVRARLSRARPRRTRVRARRRRRAGHAVADVGCGCREHCRTRRSGGRNRCLYRRLTPKAKLYARPAALYDMRPDGSRAGGPDRRARAPAAATAEDAPFVGWSALLPGLSLPYDPRARTTASRVASSASTRRSAR